MHPSKIITLICFLLSSFLTMAQQYQLNGRVSVLNSRVENGSIKYIKDVKISNEISPTRITDYKGRFELSFIDVDPNFTINLKVNKDDYEVVNKDVLKNIQIAKKRSIRIFLAKKGTVEKIEKRLFRFSQNSITARKDSIFHLLNLKAVSKDDILKELENNFGQKISDEMEAKLLLNQSIHDLEKELPNITNQMALVNLDFASDRYKKAFALFKENQLEQAIDTLDEKILDTTFENILASIEKAKETPESYQKILNIRSIQIDNVLESLELRKALLKLAFRFVEAEDLSEKIAKMKATMQEDQSKNQTAEILKDNNKPEDIVEVDQVVNILLEDTMKLALIDTNWVELEMEKLANQGEKEEEMTGDPKAKTILETLPNNSGSRIQGVDFENTLFIKNDAKPYAIPIYEQPTPVLVSTEKIINSSPNKTNESDWVVFSDVEKSKMEETSKPVIQPQKEIKKITPKSERIVFTEIIEPNYQTYKITKKTSLRQRATSSSKVLKRLKVGTEVKVIDQVDRYWSKVVLNGKIGYVKVLLLKKSN